MVDSGPSDNIAKLHKFQFKARKMINNGEFPNEKNEQLEQRFNILSLPGSDIINYAVQLN